MEKDWAEKDQENLDRYINNLSLGINDMSMNYDRFVKYRRWCVKHKEICLAENNKNSIEKFGVDVLKNYGLPEDFRFADVADVLMTRTKDAQLNPMPFDQKFYEKLMACRKIRISRPDLSEDRSVAVFKNISTSKKKSDTTVYTNWLAGTVDDQLVLFKEVVSFPHAGVLFDETNSRPGFPNISCCYELKAVLNGNPQCICDLVRVDYNPLSNHRNFMEGDIVSEEPESMYGSHVHIVNDSFNCAFPSLFGHGEAEYLDIDNGGKRLTFAQVVFANRFALNVRPTMSQKDYLTEQHAKVSCVIPEIPIGMEKGTFSERIHSNIEGQKNIYDKYKHIPIDDIAKFSDRVYRKREPIKEI